MPLHEHDENSAPDQGNGPRPTIANADKARGVFGAQPPLTSTAKQGRRKKIAAGMTAIYETMVYGVREMGTRRTLKTLLKVNQKDGFDCPSCAWPDPDGERSITEFCENGAKAVASEATTARAGPDFFASHSIAEMLAKTDYWLEQQGRITHPMFRDTGATHYQPISWPDAFKLIGDELNALGSPDAASFYTSGRSSNESAFCYQLFVRQLGTNNLPDCSNMCHESSSLGVTESIGIGKATVKLSDFEHADCIFIIGQNPATCHPRMLTHLQIAAKNGAQIVSINPLPETGMNRFRHPQKPWEFVGPGTPIATLCLPVRINGDVALLKGIMKEMLEEDDRSDGHSLDHDFIRQQTEGFETFARDIKNESWDSIVVSSGIDREKIAEAARIALKSKRMICCWAMGITQHKNGVANVQSIINFALLRAQIGRQGAGLCPVRGHSNVQGDRTVGIWEKMSDKFLESLGKEFNFKPPEKHGHDTVCTIEAMHDERVKVLISLGGNFLGATPDTNFTAEALGKCTLTVQISTKLNRAHLITGKRALILPCLGRTEIDIQKTGEQIVSVEDTMGVVHLSKGVLKPASTQLKSEVAIVCGMAMATLKKTTVDWQRLVDNYDHIRDHIEHVVPGFAQYNHRVRQPGGFYLPNGPRDSRFTTATGKARFFVHPIPIHDLGPGKLLLTTVRSHDQFNTTIYGHDDRYRGIYKGRRVIMLCEQDIADRGLKENAWVDIISHFEGETRRAEKFKVLCYAIPKGCAATYFPEANVLVPLRYVADGSNQPASKSVVITIEKCEAPTEAQLNTDAS